MLGLFLVFYYEHICEQRDRKWVVAQKHKELYKKRPKGYFATLYELPMDQKPIL